MNIGTSLYLYLPWAKGAILAAVLLYMFKKMWNCFNWYEEKNHIKLEDIKELEKTNKKIVREAKKGAAAFVVAMLVGFTMFFSFGQGKKSTVVVQPSGQMKMLENAPKVKVESKSVFTTPDVNLEEAANQAALEKQEEENRKYLENLTKEKE
jgi:hypothetical protein